VFVTEGWIVTARSRGKGKGKREKGEGRSEIKARCLDANFSLFPSPFSLDR
jgi:hypothetical protein